MMRLAGKLAVDSEDLRSFLREAQHRRATIADPLAGALPGTNDDRDLARKAHHFRPGRLNRTAGLYEISQVLGITNDESVCLEAL